MHVGQTVAGRFCIEGVAGAGAMGTVYRATDSTTGTTVAVKVLHTSDTRLADRFAREADILQRLHHPNIVGWVATGLTEAGQRFLAMDWLQGEDLSTRLKREGLEVHEAISLARKVASALGVAHDQGVVHRDVKPGNIFLVDGNPNDPRVLDFGVARLTDRDQRMTATGAALGTPAYMSPEQAGGGQQPDARADVFSLGAVLYECIAGQMAFGGDTLVDVLTKILFGDIPRLVKARPDVPAALDAVVARMLARDRTQRYADGNEAAAALAALESLRGARPMSTTVAPLVLTRAERRFVCVVVVSGHRQDHSLGLTITEEELGAEHEALHTAARTFGLRVEPMADGSLLAILETTGLPQEMVERTGRFALRAHQAVPDAPVAVASGWGVVDHQITLGGVLSRAMELLAATREPGVVVDADTAAQLDAAFEVQSEQGQWRLRGPRGARNQLRLVLGKPTPCVGRQQELALLEATFSQVNDDGEARAVVLTGPPGIGKSRLVHEFLGRLQQGALAHTLLTARADPMAAGSAWLLLGQLVRAWASGSEGAEGAGDLTSLRQRLGQRLGASDAAFAAEFLAEACGADNGEGSPLLRAARADASLFAMQVNKALGLWVRAVAANDPLVVVLEDAHWGDLPSMRALDAALRDASGVPWIALAVGRPALHERYANLWKDRGVSDVRLGRLPPRACERVIQQVLGRDVEPVLVTRILDRAEGNPYCLEELMRHVARGEHDTFPDSLLAMVQARLDAVEPFDRQVIRAASVFGHRFWVAGVAALLGGADKLAEVHDALQRLRAAELVESRPDSGLAGQAQYDIPSAMVHDAAYATLTPGDATTGHRAVARWLAHAGERNPLVLAEHYFRGGDHPSAIDQFLAAAELAQAAHDSAATAERAQRGLDAGATGAARGRLLLLQAESREWQGDLAGSEAAARDAEDLLEPGTAEWFQAAGSVLIMSARLGASPQMDSRGARIAQAQADNAAAASRQVVALCRGALNALWVGRPDLAAKWMDRADACIEADLDLLATARLHHARAYVCLNRGDLGGALGEFTAASEAWESGGDLRSCTGVSTNIGYTWGRVGAFDRAEAVLRDQLARAAKLGLGFLQPVIEHNLATVLAFAGSVDEGLALKQAVVARLGRSGHPRLDGNLQASLAEILLIAGRLDEAEATASRATESLGAFPGTQVYAMAVRSGALLGLSRPAEALAVASEAMAAFSRLGVLEEGESLLRVTWAEAQLLAGDRDEGTAALLQAARRLEGRARALPRDLRIPFLSSSPARRRTFELAESRGLTRN